MMQTLYGLVTYNYQLYAALTEEKDRRVVDQLIAKLQYLEYEILRVTEGSINISPTGDIFIRNYPLRLQRKMNLV